MGRGGKGCREVNGNGKNTIQNNAKNLKSKFFLKAQGISGKEITNTVIKRAIQIIYNSHKHVYS